MPKYPLFSPTQTSTLKAAGNVSQESPAEDEKPLHHISIWKIKLHYGAKFAWEWRKYGENTAAHEECPTTA